MGRVIHDFGNDLVWSKARACDDDRVTIQNMLDGCVSVEVSSAALDLSGVDYIATLRKSARVLIDSKTRRAGCSKYWRNGPEFALETWSVRPGGKYEMESSRSKIGWTLCEAKLVDLILFKFDPHDCEDVYLVCYQLLRMAFRRNHAQWNRQFKRDIQDNGRFESDAVFVPASVVLDAIQEAQKGRLVVAETTTP